MISTFCSFSELFVENTDIKFSVTERTYPLDDIRTLVLLATSRSVATSGMIRMAGEGGV